MKKTVLITGATKGIGYAASKRMAEAGWRVIGIARQQKADFPGKLFSADLADPTATATLLEEISNQDIHVDALVNNVGIAYPQALEEIDLASLHAVYELNVRTSVQITQHFVTAMKARKWGRIINIGSRAGKRGIKKRTSYAAAKMALIGCTTTWAIELAEFAITVNLIAPGPIETELFRRTRPVGSKEEKAVLEQIPMKRLGRPEEIAATIEFLLSDNAGFMTGQVLRVDGGSSI